MGALLWERNSPPGLEPVEGNILKDKYNLTFTITESLQKEKFYYK